MIPGTYYVPDAYDTRYVLYRYQGICLFERSEFLIATSQKKRLCVCARLILVKEGSLKRYCYRCICTTRIMYQIRMYLVSCEKHSMVVYIYINPTHGPRAWSLDDRWRLRAGGREQWTVLSGTSTIGHGLHVADRVQGLTGT